MGIEEIPDIFGDQPFIGSSVTYNEPDVLAGQSIPRECAYCFFRQPDHNSQGDCLMEHDLAKKHFGFKSNQFLPMNIEGKQVGNYCPFFTDYRCE